MMQCGCIAVIGCPVGFKDLSDEVMEILLYIPKPAQEEISNHYLKM